MVVLEQSIADRVPLAHCNALCTSGTSGTMHYAPLALHLWHTVGAKSGSLPAWLLCVCARACSTIYLYSIYINNHTHT